jgi:hypothetical protein
MRVGSSLPIQVTEYGGFETMASKGFSSPKWDQESVAQGNIELVVVDVVQENIHTGQVVVWCG